MVVQGSLPKGFSEALRVSRIPVFVRRKSPAAPLSQRERPFLHHLKPREGPPLRRTRHGIRSVLLCVCLVAGILFPSPESGFPAAFEKARPGRVLVFPTGKGSTVGSYTLYRLRHSGAAPAAIINSECETITAVGCIIAEIPCLDQVNIRQIPNGAWVRVDGEKGEIEIDLSPAI